MAGAIMACLALGDPETKADFVREFGGKVKIMLLT